MKTRRSVRRTGFLVPLLLSILAWPPVAAATILGPSVDVVPGFPAWRGSEGICHLQTGSVTGTPVYFNPALPYNQIWNCQKDTTNGDPADGRGFPLHAPFWVGAQGVQSVAVGTPVYFAKEDLESAAFGVGDYVPFTRRVTRVRWDVGDDGTVEKDESGPWPTSTSTFSVPSGPAQGTSYRVRGELIEFTHVFTSVGDIPLRVTVNYDNGTSESATGVLPVVPDAAVARISVGPNNAGPFLPPTKPISVGEPLDFSSSSSTSASGAEWSVVEWDLDGDGTFETPAPRVNGGVPQNVTRSFTEPGLHRVSLRVVSRGGGVSTASVDIDVRATPPGGETGVSINAGAQFTNTPNVNISLVWPLLSGSVLLANDGGFSGSKRLPISATVPWRLQSSGPERLPKTVYARFDASGTQTFQDDIILDETDPVVSQASATTGTGTRHAEGASVAKAKTRTYKLKLKASDKLSGVDKMQISADKRSPGKLLRYSTRATYRTSKSSVYVRARDRAGNFSLWRKAKLTR